MPYITDTRPYYLKYNRFAIILIGLSIFALLFACNEHNDRSTPINLSKVLDTVNYLYDINSEKGIHYLDSAFARHKNVRPEDRFDYMGMHFHYNFRSARNLDKAVLYADSMRMAIEVTHNEKKYAKQYGMANFAKGDVLFALNRYNEAYQYFYKGKQVGHNNFNSCTLGDYSYHMGMIMYKQEHYKVAAHHFVQSFEEDKTCVDNFTSFYRSQEILDNAALSYNKAGITDTAEIYYKKALAYIEMNAAKYPEKKRLVEMSLGVVYGNLAQLYTARKDYAKAEDLLKKSFAINLKPYNDNIDAQLSELKLAHIYADQDKTALLVPLLKNIRIQLDTVKNSEGEVDWNHLMAAYYQKQHDLKTALRYFNRYDTIKDSVTQANKKLKESDVNQQFKELENQNTINTLKSDNELQHTYLVVALVYAVMALIIILLIFINWKRSRKNLTALSELNETITQQKLQLERSLTELEIKGQEKDRIMRAVSHDLRNPIGGISSLTALMLMEPGLDEEQVELLKLIQSTTNNSLELINEILEATGVNTPKNMPKQYVDLNVLLSHSVELLKFKAAEKNQKIILELLEAPEEVFINREKVWRVLSNLISNAIKFSLPGGVITAKVMQQQGDIVIAVNDHGIGIPDNLKNQVFNMFTEAKRPGTSGEKSFGLGLSISKQIIESHDGEIWFESERHTGTTFYVKLKKQMA